jgi:threonine synthase
MSYSGIWKYADLFQPFVDTKFRLSLNEGNTLLEENSQISKRLGLETIYLKREDLNPSGSHKDRGITYEISAHLQDGQNEFVISSSGNAAISAINLLKNTKHILHIFLSINLPISKVNRIMKTIPGKISPDVFKGKDSSYENLHFHFSKKPLSNAFSFAKENNFTLLRGSTDPYGYEGFKTIAYELLEKVKDADSLFIPISSGTTAKGIYEGLKEKEIYLPFHLIQTSKINTLTHRFDQNYQPAVTSVAESIVDRIGHRVKEIEEIINTSEGTGWIVSDQEIAKAQKILEECNLQTSNESAMTIAAIVKAKQEGWDIRRPICIFTGIK